MLPILPLLPAALGAGQTTPAVAPWPPPPFVAALEGGGLAWWATRRRPRPGLRARTRRRLLMLAGSTLTLLAVLPSVIAYDHLLPRGTHADDSAAVHVSHCHDGPGSCADSPVTSGPGQMLDAASLIVAPPMLSILLLAITPTLIGVTRRPYLRPPLPLVASFI